MRIKLLRHVNEQAKERGIDIGLIKETLSNPEQIAPDLNELKIAQRRYLDKDKQYLIRVIFKEGKDLRIGITVYKTSKLKKYWR